MGSAKIVQGKWFHFKIYPKHYTFTFGRVAQYEKFSTDTDNSKPPVADTDKFTFEKDH